MCTLNGARFLASQLASLEQQTHRNWRLVVSDDGSTDATVAMLKDFAERGRHRVELRSGPRRGATANFMSLAADASIEAEYFAFADQDDVWYANKLNRALDWLARLPDGVPAVYGARTRIVDARGRSIGLAPRFAKPPTFANALAQSIAGANTMVFNRAAKRLFERTGALDVVSHDWWAYLLIVGSGGQFLYDPEPALDYRQHDKNSIGANRGIGAQGKRLRMVLDGRFARWNTVNLRALKQSSDLLTDDARARLDEYNIIRASGFFRRLATLRRSGIHRQTFFGNVALTAAVSIRKV